MIRSSKNSIKKILGSKIFLFLITLALIAITVNIGRESYRKYQLTQEINRFKIEIERLEGKNEQLANLMEYLKEESYLEKEAKLKLNLQKPGEKVVIISDILSKEVSIPEQINILVNNNSEETTNYWEWWQYFFSQ
ncbi:MAG: septum formation initiator family protein [Candidatus Portnoybacteria bacterium]|nr:septum formation initiator family protein [Candidatus Portnoybacteria bacterium]